MSKKYYHITSESKPIYVLGDMHGEISILKKYIDKYGLTNCHIIIAGDIGLGFSTRKYHADEYQELNTFLKEHNINLYLIRGNHDDPTYFNKRNMVDGVIEDEFALSNVIAVPDYTVLTIDRKNILLVGGATSIDRLYRIQGDRMRINGLLKFYPKMTAEDAMASIQPSYWEGEQPILDTDAIDEITSDGINISCVITHTCPSFSYPTTKRGLNEWMKYDSNLLFDLNKERSIMDSIYHYLIDKGHNIKEWVYGHFHTHHQEEIKNVRFTLLYNIDDKFDAYELLREG